MKSVRWIVSYILVATLGLWLAFAVSMKFMAPAQSQDAPTAGDLPADFMKEIEATQVPAAGQPASGASPSATQTNNPTADVAPPQQEPSSIPAPPMDANSQHQQMPVGDAVTAPIQPQVMPRDGYVYDPTGKRDPFRPFRTIRPAAQDAGKALETLEPLQRWELERLQIVGILWDVKTPRAMVRDPDGVVFTVTKNSKIGRAEGFVATIREGEIVVVETKYEDGKSFKEPRVMELKK